MKQMHIFYAYIDDGECTFKVPVPAYTAKEAREYASGNGEIVAIKEDKKTIIDGGAVYSALKNAGFDRYTAEIVMRLVSLCGLEYER